MLSCWWRPFAPPLRQAATAVEEATFGDATRVHRASRDARGVRTCTRSLGIPLQIVRLLVLFGFFLSETRVRILDWCARERQC